VFFRKLLINACGLPDPKSRGRLFLKTIIKSEQYKILEKGTMRMKNSGVALLLLFTSLSLMDHLGSFWLLINLLSSE
jgi:hypothetical protein